MTLAFFLGFEAGGFQLALLKVSQEFDVAGKWMGGLVAVQYTAIIIFPLLMGRLSDRIGKKTVLQVFTVTFMAGCLTVVAIPYLTGFVVGIFVLGAGFSMTEATFTAAVADMYGKQQGKFHNIVQSFFCMGAMAGPIVSDFAIRNYGFDWRVVFVICGSAFAVAFVLILFTKFAEAARDAEALSGQGAIQHSYKILATPVLMSLLVAVTMYVALENGFSFFFDLLFVQKLGAPGLSASAISLFWLAMMLGRLLGSLLHRHEKTVIRVLFLCVSVFSVAIALSGSPTMSLALCFVLGFSHGPIWPFIISLTAKEYPNDTGLATGFMLAGSGAGGALSPIFMGYLAGIFGIQYSFFALALIAVCGFLAALKFHYLKKA